MSNNEEMQILNKDAISPFKINEGNLRHTFTQDKISKISANLLRDILVQFQINMTGGGSLKIDIEDVQKCLFRLVKISNKRIEKELKERKMNVPLS